MARQQHNSLHDIHLLPQLGGRLEAKRLHLKSPSSHFAGHFVIRLNRNKHESPDMVRYGESPIMGMHSGSRRNTKESHLAWRLGDSFNA